MAMNISSVDAPDGSLVPGVERRISVTFTLLNNNEPDLNNDVAGVDQSHNGTNFNFTSYFVNVNMTAAADVTVEHQLMTVDEELVAGDVRWPIDGVQSEDFIMELTVHYSFNYMRCVYLSVHTCTSTTRYITGGIVN